MRTNESEEMYLETILLLKRKKPSVRSVDIVEELGYVKSSVSAAVKLLKEKGYVEIDADGVISLTKIGMEKATGIYDRHQVLTAALMRIGADKALAEENACRIEHVISEDLFELLKKYVEIS